MDTVPWKGEARVPFPGRGGAGWAKLVPQGSPLGGKPARWPQGSPCDPIGPDLVGSGEAGTAPGRGRGLGWSRGEGRGRALTGGFQVLAELGLGLAVGPEAAFLGELVGHGGGGDDGFETALALGHVLLRVEEDDVHLGHVEHPQGHRGAQTHRDRQRRRLDVQLGAGRGRRQSALCPGLAGALSEAHPSDRHSWGPRPVSCWFLAEGSHGIEPEFSLALHCHYVILDKPHPLGLSFLGHESSSPYLIGLL